VLLVLWIITIVYFALAVLLSTVCVDPSGVLLDVLNNTYSSGTYQSLGDQTVSISMNIPIPSGVNFDISSLVDRTGIKPGQIVLYNSTEAQTICNLPPSLAGGDCLSTNVTQTMNGILTYYLDCGQAAYDKNCLVHPLLPVEVVVGAILQLVPEILSLTQEININSPEWVDFSSDLNATVNAVTGGKITPTGAQPYGLLGAISCASLNKPVEELFQLMCTELFTEIGRSEYFLFGMVMGLVLVEIATRGLYWRGEGHDVVVSERSYSDAIQMWQIGDQNSTIDDQSDYDSDAEEHLVPNRKVTKRFKPNQKGFQVQHHDDVEL